MPPQQPSSSSNADPVTFMRNMADVAEKSARIMQEFLSRQTTRPAFTGDPFNVAGAFVVMLSRLASDPAALLAKQSSLWQDYLRLWHNTAQRLLGEDTPPIIPHDGKDRRFKDPAWQQSAVYEYILQSYLLTARWLQHTVSGVQGVDAVTARKLDFHTRQFIDALSPSNFVLTNPEVLRATLESNGENLVRGLQNMLLDLERGDGSLRVSMTNEDCFELGRNLALTPGKVVFENALMQLIQYSPSTKEVYQTPLLMIPAWINKYYILDMQPDNSMVGWLVAQGHTVFVISWVNPNERLAQKSFDDYMRQGPLAALNAIEQATGEKAVNLVGYCLGGTLLSILLSWLHARGEASRAKSATYFTTLIDFTDAGELSVFIDEEQLSGMEARMREKGYLDGADMSMTFNMLRANDLIWSFVVNNYLLGKDPFPFDLLYWNTDSTRMPAVMHSFYLRNMYLENRLRLKGGITVADVPIDVRSIRTPSMIVSAREDHIAPWKSTYAATQLYGGEVEFVLAASGHIAGMINPPVRNKYAYWTGNKDFPTNPEDWLAEAREQSGSWWPYWNSWLAKHAGEKVSARTPGAGKLAVIEDAPGRYVKEK